MTDLFWPGDERAGELMTSAALVRSMVEVEVAWLDALVATGVAPAAAGGCLGPIGMDDARELVGEVAAAAEAGGNPVIPLVKVLRRRLVEGGPPWVGASGTESDRVVTDGPRATAGQADSASSSGSASPRDSASPSGSASLAGPAIQAVPVTRADPTDPAAAAQWLHRGLTSQDVLDTALMLCLRDVLRQVHTDLSTQIDAVAALADRHRATLMAGRTLTQYAVPTTFGLKAAQWLTALLDARDTLDRLPPLAIQLGGAAGTLSAVVELTRLAGSPEPNVVLQKVSQRLGLALRPGWHTSRAPVTTIGDALVGSCDAWGRIARDVLELGRPEIGELGEPAKDGWGGSSTMAQKRNPVLSVLIRRTALSAPQFGATLHMAAAQAVDERPDGSWHAEWPALQSLSRAAASAAGQATELLTGLQVFPDRMRVNLEAAGTGIMAEQVSMRRLFDENAQPGPAADYLGLTGQLVDDVLNRARKNREAR